MKKITKFASLSVISLLAFSACADFAEHKTEVSWGTANFSKYFAVGNSITAGYQSSSLFADGQLHSYAKQIANSAGTSFEADLVSGDGIGGRIKWNGALVNGSPVFSYAPKAGGSPTNLSYYMNNDNFNNLGIPGALLVIPGTGLLGNATDFFDVNVNSTGTDALVGPGGVGGSRKNPYFNVVLANGARGSSIYKALKVSKPTFVSMWLGNNDVLGYATSGGTSPAAPTDVTVFAAKYQSVLDSILALSTAPKVVVATIPNVATIPFFTTVNPGVVSALTGKAAAIVFQKGAETFSAGTGIAPLADLTAYKHMITLTGSAFAAEFGKPSGLWVRTLALNLGKTVAEIYPLMEAGGIDTTKTFGFAPQNPWPNFLILDQDELTIAVSSILQYNGAIKAIAADPSRAARVAVVDVYTEFGKIAAATSTGSSVSFQGIPITVKFITGGLFSYDGVHPSDLGHGILANYFIGAINAKFGATLPEVNLNLLKAVRFGKKGSDSEINKIVVSPDALLNTIHAVGGFNSLDN